MEIERLEHTSNTVLPTVYDDALSYHEALGKVVLYLNQVIDQVNLQKDYLEEGVDRIEKIEENGLAAINIKMLEVNAALETINDKVSQAQLQAVSAQLAEIEQDKANKAQEVWIKPTLLNGWVEADPVTYPIGYYKDDFGRVWMRGRIQGGISGAVMFTVGTTYRPMTTVNPLMSDNDGNAKGARVTTIGQVTAFYSSATLPLRLDSVDYRAGV